MIRSFQWDLARQIERHDWLLAQLPRYAEWGYQEVHLHLEDAVDFPSLPGVARRDAYTYGQFARLVEAAGRVGIKVVPIINLLGHTQYLVKVPGLRDLNELRAPDGSPFETGQICPVHPRTAEIAEKLIGDVAPFCTAGKVHVGLDESFHLGRHPLSRAEIAEIGLAAHFARYVERLRRIAGNRGLRMGLWADMLALLPEAIPLLPAGVIAYDWYYYPFGRLPRIELHNFREYDLAGPLQARGIEYWGCPMNGAFRHEPLPVFSERLANIRDWWRRCRQVGAGGFLVSSWEPSRLAIEMTTVVDAAAACLWLEPEVDDAPGMLAAGHMRVFGGDKARAREFARTALACDERAFEGYARWEVNDRWDATAARDGTARFEAELGFFNRCLRPAARWSAPFAASLRFRRYLAERDVFVRRSAAAVMALRRRMSASGANDPGVARGIAALEADAHGFAAALIEGRKAAQDLWRLTRNRRMPGPNAAMVLADSARLKAFRRFLRAAAADPRALRDAEPVCGAWQLRFAVIQFAPALQKVVVERRREDGAWELLHARFMIEFRAFAARPRTRLRREFSVPVTGPADLLRIGVRGLGQVAVANVELTDGVSVLRTQAWRGPVRKVIGKHPPRSGLPEMDWERNAGQIELAFQRVADQPAASEG